MFWREALNSRRHRRSIHVEGTKSDRLDPDLVLGSPGVCKDGKSPLPTSSDLDQCARDLYCPCALWRPRYPHDLCPIGPNDGAFHRRLKLGTFGIKLNTLHLDFNLVWVLQGQPEARRLAGY